MGKTFVDVAVSAMVLVVAAMFAWFAYSSTHAGNTRGYELAARFHTVAGLAPGADVKISGIKVGAVTGMEIVPVIFDAKVRFSLDPAIKLPVDSKAKIVGEGLLGSAIMVIEPGQQRQTIAAGGEITDTESPEDAVQSIGKKIFGAAGDR
jgi:phospholipid/cholesterol/gamma-HCH transport system substrate-binding protein